MIAIAALFDGPKIKRIGMLAVRRKRKRYGRRRRHFNKNKSKRKLALGISKKRSVALKNRSKLAVNNLLILLAVLTLITMMTS
jgi:hypothetical protein